MNIKEKIPVIAVVGPTASGKTKLAINIAKKYQGEVISADSMQIYRGMNIATAKPTLEEMQGIPHHLMDFLDISIPFSVADYTVLAHNVIKDIYTRGKLSILAGGTGLYIDSVLNDIRFSEIKSDPKLRKYLSSYAKINGAKALLNKLREIDPETANSLHENNLGRVIRAIEVYHLTGIPMSEHRRRSIRESRYRTLKFGLDYKDRKVLYERINTRVDAMMEKGLLQEAKEFLSINQSQTAAQAIGYKELAGYFDGKINLSEAVENLKRKTRHYAKRQLTWFRKDSSIHWLYLDCENASTIQKKINVCMENFLRM